MDEKYSYKRKLKLVQNIEKIRIILHAEIYIFHFYFCKTPKVFQNFQNCADFEHQMAHISYISLSLNSYSPSQNFIHYWNSQNVMNDVDLL